MRGEAFGLDRRPGAVQPGRDMDLIACILGGACHGQAMGEKIPILGDDVKDAGGHGRVLPVRAHKTSSAVLLFLAQANRRAAVVLSKSRSPTYAKWLVAPGPIPIATAAWSAPASCGAANPGPPPRAPRTGAAAGRFLDRRVIGSRRGNGCRRSPGERTSSPNCAECRERKNELSHRIPPCLRKTMIAVPARDKKAA